GERDVSMYRSCVASKTAAIASCTSLPDFAFTSSARPIFGSVAGFGLVTSRARGSGACANCPDGRFGAGAGTPRGVGGTVGRACIDADDDVGCAAFVVTGATFVADAADGACAAA